MELFNFYYFMKKIYFNFKTIVVSLLLLSSTIQAQINVILGPGTTAHSTTSPGPINEFYRSLHAQTVYTAAELNAAGVFGGTITKLGWYVVSGVTNPLPNYSIKLKHTTATNATTYDATGLTQHYINHHADHREVQRALHHARRDRARQRGGHCHARALRRRRSVGRHARHHAVELHGARPGRDQARQRRRAG